MSVGLFVDEVFLHHQAPADHPECPQRLAAVRDALDAAGIPGRTTRVAVRAATDEEITRVHSAAYLAELERDLPGRRGYLDADTFFSPESLDAARKAAGAAAEAALQALSGQAPRSLVLVRPPGHHAEAGYAMGFCLINNVAVAAAAARAAGAARVAIVDWDVHHGNGTQHIFETDPDVLYVSTHQWPFYPGTGAAHEIGRGAGRGATLNLPLPARSGDLEYVAAFTQVIVPAIRAFKPDLILISAGYDAHGQDPLGGMRVTTEGYRQLTAALRALAAEVCGDRVVLVLEGGYDLAGLSSSVGASAEVLLAAEVPRAPATPADAGLARPALAEVRRALAGHLGF